MRFVYIKTGRNELRDGCFSRRAKVRDLLWKLFFTAFRAANESAGGVRAPAPPNLETGSDDVIAGSCQHHCTLHSAASNSLLPHPPVVRLLCSCSVIMSELAFCKTFLGAIDSRPIKLSSDYVSDARTYPATGVVRLAPSPSATPPKIPTSINVANKPPSQSSPVSPKATPSAPLQRPPATPRPQSPSRSSP